MNFFSKLKKIQINNKKDWKRFLQFFLGCLIVALSYNLFIASNNLVPGGVGGIAIILNSFLDVDKSIIILLINVILLLFSYILLGKEKTKTTLLGSLLFPLLVKITEFANVWMEFDTTQVLLMAIVGGLFYGTGAGLIFKAGFTTGGTDILNQIISKYGKISMGKSMLLSDGVIVLISGLSFGAPCMLYSVLVLYMISVISDRIVLGISSNKMFYIITKKDREIKRFILKDMGLGATEYKVKCGPKQQNNMIIMTVLPTKRYYEFINGIERIDQKAFFIVTDSYEVFGGEENG